jgi:nicotinate phosphoribosyltransferase
VVGGSRVSDSNYHAVCHDTIGERDGLTLVPDPRSPTPDPRSPIPDPRFTTLSSALSTDLYQLAMMAGYHAAGVTGLSTFELFVRELPPRRSVLIAAGLDQALDWIERVRFEAEEIAWLRTVPALAGAPPSFFDEVLPAFRFAGDVWAVDEGEPVFEYEPILRVTAPALQAQFVETALLAIITFQTSIASKAVRIVEAARGRGVVEFGSRRAHGIEAALYAARAAYLAGCHGTSNVEAGYRFGIPVSGTMAHSWVMSFDNEIEAFRRFMSVYGERATLLIDTYDTVRAARNIVAAGLRPAAVRLDSGDIAALSREVRAVLDAGGLGSTQIFASGDLDEDRIAALIDEGAPIDLFGVGTALSTSCDAPALGGIYKLVEIVREGRALPTAKLSTGKRTYPGRKQVWRRTQDGTAVGDVIGLERETGIAGRPLLRPVMRDGQRVEPLAPLTAARERCRTRVQELPDTLLAREGASRYPVVMSPDLDAAAGALWNGFDDRGDRA